MIQRTELLYNTIGYLPEEQKAKYHGIVILLASSSWIVFSGFLEWTIFKLYNENYHPFANILKTTSE